MKYIPLSQGQRAMVDDADYEWLSEWRWTFTQRPDRRVGYAYRQPYVGGRYVNILMHRAILGLLDQPQVVTDHINGLGLDNRRENIRPCTHLQNMRNQRKALGAWSSQYKGVSFNKPWGKWTAQIRVNYELVHLGGYLTEADAALAYNAAALDHFGEFARLNDIPMAVPA
jgi:hypothetical protein